MKNTVSLSLSSFLFSWRTSLCSTIFIKFHERTRKEEEKFLNVGADSFLFPLCYDGSFAGYNLTGPAVQQEEEVFLVMSSLSLSLCFIRFRFAATKTIILRNDIVTEE